MRASIAMQCTAAVVGLTIGTLPRALANHFDTILFDYDSIGLNLGVGASAELPGIYDGGSFWLVTEADGHAEVVSLDAVGLGGQTVYVQFDLLVIGEWIGEPTPTVASRFRVDYFGQTVFDHSFSNLDSAIFSLFLQSFGSPDGELVPGGTGAASFVVGELAVYPMSFKLPVVSGVDGFADIDLQFQSTDSPGLGFFVFGIDNLIISGRPLTTDWDGDGVFNYQDNCLQHANADQADANRDNIGNRCDADLNGDCVVNYSDLARLRQVFFTDDAEADFNNDGDVNFLDLGIIKSNFFGAPGPSGLPNACDFE